jgi:hypothetical protein
MNTMNIFITNKYTYNKINEFMKISDGDFAWGWRLRPESWARLKDVVKWLTAV